MQQVYILAMPFAQLATQKPLCTVCTCAAPNRFQFFRCLWYENRTARCPTRVPTQTQKHVSFSSFIILILFIKTSIDSIFRYATNRDAIDHCISYTRDAACAF